MLLNLSHRVSSREREREKKRKEKKKELDENQVYGSGGICARLLIYGNTVLAHYAKDTFAEEKCGRSQPHREWKRRRVERENIHIIPGWDDKWAGDRMCCKYIPPGERELATINPLHHTPPTQQSCWKSLQLSHGIFFLPPATPPSLHSERREAGA